MLRYALRRVGLAVPTLLGMSILIFAMVRLLPGDVVDALQSGDTGASAAKKEALRRSLGLTDPIPVQYGKFIGGILSGNFGSSLVTGRPVSQVILGALPITLELAFLAAVVAAVVAIPLGVSSALRPNSVLDAITRVGALAGVAVPGFWLATLILLLTSVVFRWIPPVVWVSPLQNPLGNLSQIAIPVLAVAAYPTAIVMRMARGSMLEVLGEDYVRTARAKGGSWSRVIFRHGLRNALVPVITVLGFELGSLLSGATVIEVMFGLPGMGYTLMQAVYTRDYPVIQVTALLLALVFILVNLAVDLLYGVIDPRIQQS